jgi:iron-sulfur cluster assembly accessory protein
MEQTMKAPVSLTQSAISEIRRLIGENQSIATSYLRIGVKGGGCSGMTYILEFDDKQETDELFVIEGINCIMNKTHGIYLMGMQIDWEGGLNSRGFVFNNPNASTTCGCGTSFGV